MIIICRLQFFKFIDITAFFLLQGCKYFYFIWLSISWPIKKYNDNYYLPRLWEYTEITFVENFLIYIYFITTNYYEETLFSQRTFNLKKQETRKINLWPKMCLYEILVSPPTLGKIVTTVILSGDYYYNNNYVFCTNHFCSGSYGISITWNIS